MSPPRVCAPAAPVERDVQVAQRQARGRGGAAERAARERLSTPCRRSRERHTCQRGCEPRARRPGAQAACGPPHSRAASARAQPQRHAETSSLRASTALWTRYVIAAPDARPRAWRRAAVSCPQRRRSEAACSRAASHVTGCAAQPLATPYAHLWSHARARRTAAAHPTRMSASSRRRAAARRKGGGRAPDPPSHRHTPRRRAVRGCGDNACGRCLINTTISGIL